MISQECTHDYYIDDYYLYNDIRFCIFCGDMILVTDKQHFVRLKPIHTGVKNDYER